MERRLELHEIFCDILGSRNVYYKPPASVQMKYPAIVYSPKAINNVHANNGVYTQFPGFEVIVIDPNSDSEYVKKVSKLPKCRFDRHYKSDNLNHDAFTIY